MPARGCSGAATAKMILGRVRDELSRLEMRGDRDERFRVTFSAGVACYPTDGNSFEQLFKAVDKRLYDAKNDGRDKIEI